MLTLIDDKGQIQAIRQVSQDRPTTVMRYIRLGAGRSLYAILGDWFIWFCLLLEIFYLYKAIFSTQKNGSKKRTIFSDS